MLYYLYLSTFSYSNTDTYYFIYTQLMTCLKIAGGSGQECLNSIRVEVHPVLWQIPDCFSLL